MALLLRIALPIMANYAHLRENATQLTRVLEEYALRIGDSQCMSHGWHNYGCICELIGMNDNSRSSPDAML